MITIIRLILSIPLFLAINISAEEMVKVTNFGKGIQVTVGSEKITPKMDEELPLNAKIESGKMGFLEFEYKEKIYRVRQNTTIFLWEVVKAGGDERFQPDVKSGPTGARGTKEAKQVSKKRKSNKKKVEKANAD